MNYKSFFIVGFVCLLSGTSAASEQRYFARDYTLTLSGMKWLDQLHTRRSRVDLIRDVCLVLRSYISIPSEQQLFVRKEDFVLPTAQLELDYVYTALTYRDNGNISLAYLPVAEMVFELLLTPFKHFKIDVLLQHAYLNASSVSSRSTTPLSWSSCEANDTSRAREHDPLFRFRQDMSDYLYALISCAWYLRLSAEQRVQAQKELAHRLRKTARVRHVADVLKAAVLAGGGKTLKILLQ